ncbi:MAG: methyltransferase [Thermoplasmata archaeon]|jgi:methyltransferase|nr:methyltransferase [Thermoplasmata archaeon]
MMPLLAGALVVVGVQRLAELAYARHTAKGLAAQGARPVRPDGMLGIVAVHVLFFAACAAEDAVRGAALGWWTPVGIGFFVAGAALRYWSMLALGGRWSTRVWVLPEAPLVAKGPYCHLRHPIYLGVTFELLGFAAAFGLWAAAVAVPLLNLVAVRRRVAVEEQALGFE